MSGLLPTLYLVFNLLNVTWISSAVSSVNEPVEKDESSQPILSFGWYIVEVSFPKNFN